MQYKDSIKIDICRLCKSKNLIKVFDLGTTPLANSYCSKIKSLKLKKYPLALKKGIPILSEEKYKCLLKEILQKIENVLKNSN